MNILFLSLLKFSSFDEHNLYVDLLRRIIDDGHNVFAVCPLERRNKETTSLNHFGNSSILSVKTLNIQKANILEKGVCTLTIKNKFIKAIKKYYHGIKFDIVLYPTPPITLCKVVKYFKKRDNAHTYLMLKDIFPQNAVDIGIMKKKGLMSLLYKYFRRQEIELYNISDKIGCMSQANIDYLLKQNKNLNEHNIELFPNCIEPQKHNVSETEVVNIRKKYHLPINKSVYIYGGNLGKPQNIPFVIECLKAEKSNQDVFFLIIGDGTDYYKLEEYAKESKQKNFKLLKRVSSKEFDVILSSCDVGLIFLDYRFTIPNFPSRILSYLEASLPVLACTDCSTDVGKIIKDGDFGFWCESKNPVDFVKAVKIMESNDKKIMGAKSRTYLEENFAVSSHYKKILNFYD